jgi:rhodanese-related sulfurtransferase
MFWKQEEKVPVITPDELATVLAKSKTLVLVDVRGEQDYRQGHLPGAVHIPLSELERRAAEIDSTKPTVFY